MTTNKKEPHTTAEVISIVLMGIALYVFLTVVIVSIGAVLLMFAWGLIAPVFALPLLNFPAAFAIVLIVWVVSRFIK